jgi:hypothetical protein
MFLVLPIYFIFASKDPFKNDDAKQKNVYGGPCTFDSEKPLAFIICGECMAQIFGITFVFSCFNFF